MCGFATGQELALADSYLLKIVDHHRYWIPHCSILSNKENIVIYYNTLVIAFNNTWQFV